MLIRRIVEIGEREAGLRVRETWALVPTRRNRGQDPFVPDPVGAGVPPRFERVVAQLLSQPGSGPQAGHDAGIRIEESAEVLVAAVGVLVAAQLFLILQLSHPYVGEIATSPEPLREVINVLSPSPA